MPDLLIVPTCRRCGRRPAVTVGLPVYVTFGDEGVAIIGVNTFEMDTDYELSCGCADADGPTAPDLTGDERAQLRTILSAIDQHANPKVVLWGPR